MPELFLGLMSGTSLDGVDAVLLDFSQNPPRLLQHQAWPLAEAFKAQLLALNTSGVDELHCAAQAANELALTYAQAVTALLDRAQIKATDVQAIGAHGQTVRHQPAPNPRTGVGYTLQLNNPALLAEYTGIDVVADFRSADVAAGGQGAPLVPAFHQAWFAQSGRSVAVLNLGGMSNLTLLPSSGPVQGFDCGPGNVLIDLWCARQRGQPYDCDGAWAASGTVLPALLEQLLAEPYFAQEPPKSTGRDLFNAVWLERQLGDFSEQAPQDIAATLTALTAQVCTRDLLRYAAQTQQLWVCGGGALNAQLMRQLTWALPQVQVQSSAACGLAPMEVEAAAFAWLARAHCRGEAGNLPAVTGARGLRVLGALYPASRFQR